MTLGAPLVVGCVMIASMVPVQALAITAIVRLVRRQVPRDDALAHWLHDVGVFTCALLLLVAAQLVQIAAWAVLFLGCGEFDGFSSAFYRSAVNFTTLGSGEVALSPAWRLLGPLEAVAGMLMFGVSTAVLFAVAQALIHPEQIPRTAR